VVGGSGGAVMVDNHFTGSTAPRIVVGDEATGHGAMARDRGI
jgi:hypothetical protein